MTLVKCNEECKYNIDGICKSNEIELEVSFQDLCCQSFEHRGV